MKKLQKGTVGFFVLCMAAVGPPLYSGKLPAGVVAAAEETELSLPKEPGVRTVQKKPVKLPVESWVTDNGDQYTGMKADEHIQGYGTVTYQNGNSYEGYFAKDTGEKNKYGVYCWEEEAYKGWRYEGNFSNGAREGYGVSYYPSGEQYAGEYLNDTRDGYGVTFRADGTAAQVGIWKNGEFTENSDMESWTDDSGNQWYGTRNTEGNLEGKGICLTSDGTCQIGFFIGTGGLRGKGFEYNHSGFYIGNFSDERSGYGILRLTEEDLWQEGNFTDGSLNGYGISRYPTGWYEGEWTNGTVDGIGIRFLADGSLEHAGEWVMGEYQEDSNLESWADENGSQYVGKKDDDGLLQGEGIQFKENGSRYIGSFQSGILTRGAGFYFSGAWYSGEWKDGNRNGYGRYHYNVGSNDSLYYEGNFVQSEQKGYGAYEWRDGARFEGAWSGGARNGMGLEFNRDGTISDAGIWSENTCQKDSGLENWTDDSGHQYFGVRNQEGRIEGEGILIYSNGVRYIGEFTNGSRDGYGVLYYANNACEEGEYKDGTANGAFVHHSENGMWMVGLHKDGAWSGAALRIKPDGEYLYGRLKEGEYYGYWAELGRYHDVSLGAVGEDIDAGETWMGDDSYTSYIGSKNAAGQIDGEGASLSPAGYAFIGTFEAGNQREGALFYYGLTSDQSYFYEGTIPEGDGVWDGTTVYYDSETGRIAKTV